MNDPEHDQPPRDTSPRHLLTVLHAAERTGPPLLALQFLRWLADRRPDWRLSTVFLDQGGDLLVDFEALGPAVVARDMSARALQRAVTQDRPVDLSHVHCAGSMRIVPRLPKAPVLCHVHELAVGQEFHMGAQARSSLARAARFVAVSDAVRQELLERFPLDPELVDRQWGFVDDAQVCDDPGPERRDPDDSRIVVIGSGVRHWRKAPEVFVRVASLAARRHPEVDWRFVWLGGNDASGLEQKVADADLGDVVEFVGHQPDPLRWVATADVFLLSAREDAFPLVCVEAAALGRPLVSFDSGGTPELIRAAGCGTSVPFPDVDSMVSELARLARDPQLRADLGAAGRAFAQEHLVLSRAAPRLLATIERTMAAS